MFLDGTLTVLKTCLQQDEDRRRVEEKRSVAEQRKREEEERRQREVGTGAWGASFVFLS